MKTSIEWTSGPNGEVGYTFNPVEGCQRVSPGCVNCYAERKNKWLRRGENWGPGTPRLARSDVYWKQPLKWNREAESEGQRRKVFCASVADVFEDHPDWLSEREKLWALILLTPQLDWLLLTKRPENIDRFLPSPSQFGRINGYARALSRRDDIAVVPTQAHGMVPYSWPLPNVWLGTTVEDQQRANERIDQLIAVPAVVHFLSVEPMIERVDISPWLFCEHCGYSALDQSIHGDHQICEARHPEAKVPSGIDWVICGGESGPGARLFDIEWARHLLDDCISAGVPFFMKQLGAHTDVSADNPERLTMFYRKKESADLLVMPEDLRVREFPIARSA